MRLLSTKILSQEFRSRLLMHQFSLVEKSFIQIIPLKNPLIDSGAEALIFTSQNAVNLVFSSPKLTAMIEGKTAYCVGKKTAALLIEKGQKVAKTTQNSTELAHFLTKSGINKSFFYFCGKLRTPHLEEVLPAKGIAIQPIEVYETHLIDFNVKGHFDGILFFSPSAVRAYALSNGFENTHSFCLGTSTAQEVALHTEHYTVAKEPNESQLLLLLKNHITLHEE
ncbi:MAG: uroporphyrinogen-III synthase [Flavobacteriaceae bacterium]